jgi:sulfite exporter TauE/SafE
MAGSISILAALAAGAGSSLHCVGMCGGIAAALAARAHAPAGARRLWNVTAHHVGRLVSYMLAGALAGGVGALTARSLPFAAAGAWLRLAAACVVVLVGFGLVWRLRVLLVIERFGGYAWARIAPLAGRVASRAHVSGPFLLGGLWGFLPCGLVYSMLVLAAMTGSAQSGALVMGAFGAGTLPAMFASSCLAERMSRGTRLQPLRAIAATALIGFGIASAIAPGRMLMQVANVESGATDAHTVTSHLH